MKNRKKIKLGIIKNKNVQMLLIGVLAVVMIIIFVGISVGKKMTKLEQISLENNSKNVITYIEEVENSKSKEIDKYINYALEYNYNENNQTETSVKDIKKIINNIFSVKITEKQIKKIGITPSMLDKRISYNYENETFTISKSDQSYSDIASTKIYYYDYKKIIKKNSEKYVIQYDKYVVSNPYEILNYYEDLNRSEKVKKKYNTEEILNYLTSKANVKTIKKYITNKNANKVAKKKGTVEIEYIIQNDKILINNITSKK